MRCIVLWQFSLLGVLALVITGWHCFVYAEALPITGTTSDSHELKPSHSTSSINKDKSSTSTLSAAEDSLEEQLRDDQAALSRMITILSLIGGLGGIAVVATIVIVTKTRRRKRREMEKEGTMSIKNDEKPKPTGQQPTLTDHHHQRQSSSHSTDFIIDRPSAAQHNNECNNASHDALISTVSLTNSDSDSSKKQSPSSPQPSAPPNAYSFVPTMTTNAQHRRVISLPSQRQIREDQPTPIPSAPSAKELDSARILRESGPHESSYQGQNEPYYYSGPSTNPMTPDLPPPAYTPKASPFYDGSQPSASVNITVAQLTTLRRHSQT